MITHIIICMISILLKMLVFLYFKFYCSVTSSEVFLSLLFDTESRPCPSDLFHLVLKKLSPIIYSMKFFTTFVPFSGASLMWTLVFQIYISWCFFSSFFFWEIWSSNQLISQVYVFFNLSHLLFFSSTITFFILNISALFFCFLLLYSNNNISYCYFKKFKFLIWSTLSVFHIIQNPFCFSSMKYLWFSISCLTMYWLFSSNAGDSALGSLGTFGKTVSV